MRDAPARRGGAVTLLLELPFTAAHRIRIAGELEPVHGHDFRCAVEVGCDDERDAALLEPALRRVLGTIERTGLERVEAEEGGCASAERVARWLHRALARELASDAALRVARVTVHEAPGCSASWRE